MDGMPVDDTLAYCQGAFQSQRVLGYSPVHKMIAQHFLATKLAVLSYYDTVPTCAT
jgi:hypothetical protein